jgi:hypothetical protein
MIQSFPAVFLLSLGFFHLHEQHHLRTLWAKLHDICSHRIAILLYVYYEVNIFSSRLIFIVFINFLLLPHSD